MFYIVFKIAESVTSDFEAEDEEWTFLAVLGKGITFEYVVPSFPVFRANLTSETAMDES